MDTCLLGSRNLETREEGALGSGTAAPHVSVLLYVSPQWRDPLQKGERPARELAEVGVGHRGVWDSAQSRTGGCRWLARTSSVRPHRAGAGSFVSGTPGSSGSIFQEAQGLLFLQRLTRNPACPSVPEEPGLASQSLINVNGEAEGWPFSAGGVSMAWLIAPPQAAPCASQTPRDRATEGVSPVRAVPCVS